MVARLGATYAAGSPGTGGQARDAPPLRSSARTAREYPTVAPCTSAHWPPGALRPAEAAATATDPGRPHRWDLNRATNGVTRRTSDTNARKVVVVLRGFPPFRTLLVVVGCQYGSVASATIRVFETLGKADVPQPRNEPIE